MAYDGVRSTHFAQDSGCCEDGNEFLVSVKAVNFCNSCELLASKAR
jgi:hypothetical protein